MSICVTLSLLMLQAATVDPVQAMASLDAGLVSRLDFDLLLRAIFVWIGFVVFCVAVFTYRRNDDAQKEGFEAEYQKKLEIMRKGSHD
ncbi:hypothetical protein [Oricola thermophila]|uniref:Uncharacterized protein n=1 Tax=Oricola thermophila TaxID=2742145 RepID=A0A6N1VCI1_9HYPH|nr:hypothetical protein [Oricola thermophila]QKV17275.1 hypothetical protein HTY61_01740 [Oricola thermophila]